MCVLLSVEAFGRREAPGRRLAGGGWLIMSGRAVVAAAGGQAAVRVEVESSCTRLGQ